MAGALFLLVRAVTGVRVVVVLGFRGVTAAIWMGAGDSVGFETRAVLLVPAGKTESR